MPWPIISCARKSSWATRRPWPACWGSLPPATRCAAWLRNWMASDFRLPRIDVAQRYFLDYDSIAFSATPKYSYQHPIPECRVYEHGTIYRILLGTFNTKRAVSTFRGAYPLSYLVGEDKKWCYYAGGFATREEAEAAQKLLKSKGFVRPEIVVWTDGAYRNLSRDPEAQQIAYRVEITGTEALPTLSRPLSPRRPRGCEPLARGTAVVRGGDVRRQGRGRPRGRRNNTGRPVFGNKSRRNCGIIEFIAYL